MNRDYIIDVFKKYTDAYDASDEKIRLKIEHTFFVAELSDTIADSLGLKGRDKDLAWLIGMLHDIGRFEQLRRFDTFMDAQSIDHAEFGADLLFKEGLIKRFQQEEELALIELAIRQHNKYRICDGLSERELMYCNIIRDADKIDILRVNINTPMEVIYGVSTTELKTSPITPEVLQCFHEKHCVLRSLKKTPIDNLIGHITLVYELVYPMSRRLAKEQGYLDQMMAYESDHPKTREQMADMRIAMAQWLEENS